MCSAALVLSYGAPARTKVDCWSVSTVAACVEDRRSRLIVGRIDFNTISARGDLSGSMGGISARSVLYGR